MGEDKNLQLKYRRSLEKFIKKFKRDNNVRAIIVTGSYVYLELDKNSDLDIYILLKSSKTRERGNTWVDGVEIEYFINPIKQVKNYLKQEAKIGKYSTAHILADSIILHQKDKSIDDLVELAKRILKNKRKMTNYDIELAKYTMDNLKKDLEDVYLRRDSFTFQLIANEIFTKSIKFFKEYYDIKLERNKKSRAVIKEKDPAFEKLLLRVFYQKSIDKHFDEINKVIKYIEKMLGGKKNKHWKIISDCTFGNHT